MNGFDKLPYKSPLVSDQKQYSLHFPTDRTLGESTFPSQSDNKEHLKNYSVNFRTGTRNIKYDQPSHVGTPCLSEWA